MAVTHGKPIVSDEIRDALHTFGALGSEITLERIVADRMTSPHVAAGEQAALAAQLLIVGALRDLSAAVFEAGGIK